MIFEEILVRFEYWKNSLMNFLPGRTILKTSVNLYLHYTIFSIWKRTIPLNENRLDWVKAHKCSFFKVEKISSIWSASFRVENYGRIKTLLGIFLPLVYLILSACIAHFWITINVNTSSYLGDVTNYGNVLSTLLCHTTWRIVCVNKHIHPTWVIATNGRRSFIGWLPIWSKIFSVINMLLFLWKKTWKDTNRKQKYSCYDLTCPLYDELPPSQVLIRLLC